MTSGTNTRKPSRTEAPLLLCPAYNAEASLPELIRRIDAVYDSKHFVVVDDGSTDSSSEILQRSRIKHLRLNANRGKGTVLKLGYRWAKRRQYDAVLTIDSDLQHAPEDIPEFLSSHRKAPQSLLLGCRDFRTGSMPLARQFSNNLSSLLISIFSGVRVRDSQCGFRLTPLALLKHAPANSKRFMYESETLFMLGACGADIREVQVDVVYNDSHSYINPFLVIIKFIGLFWRRLWY